MLRYFLFLLALVLLTPSNTLAGHVHLEGPGGIVATEALAENWMYVLTADGQVWLAGHFGWDRQEESDPPMPVEEVAWWNFRSLVTTADEVWWRSETGWTNVGSLPTSGVENDPRVRLEATSAFPNPTSSFTRIVFTLEAPADATIDILDAAGRKVRTLRNGQSPAGSNAVRWDGIDNRGEALPSGTYFYALSLDGEVAEVRKIQLVR